jgi:D-3-phosphoglycerate dehydrogenase / 2-oxoglutarate reductase
MTATAPSGGRVLLTDHPWAGTEIESAVVGDAGYELIEAPPGASPTDLLELGGDVVGIITCWSPVPRALITASPDLVAISRLGVGVDNIDLLAAAEHGVTVTRVPDYCVEEVSDHVAALILAWARGISYFDRSIRAGRWEPGALPLRRVRDLVIGVWGSGNIGMRTAQKMASFGCTMLRDDRHGSASDPDVVPVAELLERSDVISLHLPLNESTRNIVDASVFGAMRPGSLLVNTGRGGLVDTEALVAALASGRPAAAALDVLPDEPHVPTALMGRDDVLLTPHVGFSSVQSVLELRRRAPEDLVRVLRGEQPHHPVALRQP